MDKVVHFEILADDMARAQAFYEKTFSWHVNAIPNMGYAILTTGPTDTKRMPEELGFINGGMMKRTGALKSPIITIHVTDMDAALERVKKNGGKIVMDKRDVGDIGVAAYVSDTEGNIIGLWKPLKW